MVTLDISMSLDGYITGVNVRPEAPLGDDGGLLYRWSEDGGDKEGRKRYVAALDELGAVIVGRRTYDLWIPEWGADGPSGTRRPAFVVTHEAPTDATEGGVYTFVTEGIEAALQAAQAAAGGKKVVVGGGASLAQQYLRAGLIDEISVHFAPVLLGGGTRLFDHLGDVRILLTPIEVAQTGAATHLRWHVAH